MKKLAKATETKKLFGLKTRFANEEMILRFFAFNEGLNNYHGKLSKFLNDYMFNFRNFSEDEIETKSKLYFETTNLIYEVIFDKTPATSYGKTFLEGLLYGISQNLEKLKLESPEKLKSLFDCFKALPEYSVQSLKEGLAAKEKVNDRFIASKNCFAN